MIGGPFGGSEPLSGLFHRALVKRHMNYDINFSHGLSKVCIEWYLAIPGCYVCNVFWLLHKEPLAALCNSQFPFGSFRIWSIGFLLSNNSDLFINIRRPVLTAFGTSYALNRIACDPFVSPGIHHSYFLWNEVLCTRTELFDIPMVPLVVLVFSCDFSTRLWFWQQYITKLVHTCSWEMRYK